jgi:hypothetical protein
MVNLTPHAEGTLLAVRATLQDRGSDDTFYSVIDSSGYNRFFTLTAGGTVDGDGGMAYMV